MHQQTRANLPAIAAGLLANKSFAAIGADLRLTGNAVSRCAAKWLPGLYALAGHDAGAAGKQRVAYRRRAA